MLKDLFTQIVAMFKAIFTSLFGVVSWRGPRWFDYLRQRCNANPGQCWRFITASLAILALLLLGYHWYKNRPQPTLVTAHIAAPQITLNTKNAIPDVVAIDFGIVHGDSFSNQSVAPLKDVGKDVTDDISLTPAKAGKWTWQTDSHLVFTPAEDWPAGQKYTVHFNKHFFADTAKLKSLDYQFSTQDFQLTIPEFKFYQDPIDAQLRQLVATISFNYPVDTNSFENKITLIQQALKNTNAQHYKFTINYDERKREAYLHSESLPIGDVARFVELTIAKGVKANVGSSATRMPVSHKVLIPDASSYFKVSATGAAIVRNEKDRPEQVLTLETTFGVADAALNKSLHVYLLPKDYPASITENTKKDYEWTNPGEVTAAILALSTPLDLTAIPADRDYATLHSYKFKAETPRFIYLKLDQGVKGFGNFALSQDYVAVIKVPEYPKEIGFLHKGALLALSGEKKLSVIVRGVPGVKFKIARVLPGDVNQLITQTRGDLNNPRFINPHFNQDNISEIFSETQQFDATDLAKEQYTALEIGKYLSAKTNTGGPQGLFLLQAMGWDEASKKALDVKASRLILMTDMGLLVKNNSDNSHDVYVQSITQGKPVVNATISVLGKNGLPILSRTTDANGHVNFPTLKDFIEEREPTVYLAQLNNDVAFIPFNNLERQLNYSRFDIGGVYNNGEELQTLSAYVFSDRGIYRPGDTVHVAMIVKQAYVQPQPAGLPLEATVIDPRGMTVKDQKFTLDPSGYLSLDFTTTDTSPTGQYTVNLFIVKDKHPSNLLGSTSVRVAEFLPDSMRITAHLSTEKVQGWVQPANLIADVGLWNLYGAPATDRKVSANILLTPEIVKFTQFPNYIFSDPLLDPLKPPKVFTDTLADVRTNDKGLAQFDLKLERFEKATYQLTFFAEGFEADGGRSVTTQTHILVSPLDYLVGYKTDGDLNYLKQNSQHQIHFIAVNSDLKQQAVADLKIQLLSLRPVTTLVKKADGTYQYQSLVQTSIVNTHEFSIAEQGVNYLLETGQIGDFALVVLDKKNTELSRLKFSVVGNSQQPLPKNAELTMKLDKNEFMPDTNIEMQITAPYVGAGLITLERDKVYAQQWFTASTTSSMQKIHIPKDFQGNGYVNVAFVRDWNSDEIFVSPLSYTITPFMVNHANRAMNIELDVPALVKPGEDLTINYKSDKPGKIIVYAVDEGILQAAGYKTPDPLNFFFQKRALEVNTFQTLDQILPKFVQDRELSAVGGDSGGASALKTLNPFKRKTDLPVVFWSGIVDTDTTSKQLVYHVPDYFNGAIRVMAVAVATDAVGATTKTAEVRGNFVITPNVPTFVAPGDEFEVSASVANNVQGSGENASVTVQFTTSSALEIIGDDKQVLKISEGKEQSVHFKLRAKSVLGSATLTFAADSLGKSSQINSTLSVRPATAYSTTLISGYHAGSQSLAIDRVLYPEYRTVDAAISSNPLILVVGLNRYLENFPFGCTEQLTSKALPLLALAKQTWFTSDSRAVTEKIETFIQTLAQRQMSNGALSYWPDVAANESNAFASVYALHFLTDARAQGYDVPMDMLRSGMSYLKDLAAETPTSLNQARVQAYAIYVLTRNEIVTTNYLTNLQLYLDQDKTAAWHNDITSAYIASTYQLLKSEKDANRLIEYYQPQQKQKSSDTDFYDKNIADAQYLYLIARHFPARLSQLNNTVLMPLVTALNSGEMSTVLSGYASLALSAYAEAYPAPSSQGYTMTALFDNGKEKLLTTNDAIYQKVSLDDLVKKINFKGPNNLGYFYQVTQAGFDKNPTDKIIKKGLEVDREYIDSSGKAVTSVNVGNEITVHIKVRALDNHYLTNIAIVDLLPGGFDVVRDSVNSDDIDYADVREDRVVFFTSVGPDVKEIVYRIKAVNAGKYVTPAILASSMYDTNVISNGIAGSIAVTPS
ncbi:MAG: alpha-2-macroglobulin [Gammaproteobacteria bacterium]|nr:alpha-2-macroglobulin [Gammaproteobacteria bacterium]